MFLIITIEKFIVFEFMNCNFILDHQLLIILFASVCSKNVVTTIFYGRFIGWLISAYFIFSFISHILTSFYFFLYIYIYNNTPTLFLLTHFFSYIIFFKGRRLLLVRLTRGGNTHMSHQSDFRITIFRF